MREALVTASKIEVKVPDLGLYLHKGQSIYLEVDQVARSKDLQQIITEGIVDFEWVERVMTRRQPPAAPPPPLPPFGRSTPGVRAPTQSRMPVPPKTDPSVLQELRLLREALSKVLPQDLGPLLIEVQNLRSAQMDLTPILTEIRTLKESLDNLKTETPPVAGLLEEIRLMREENKELNEKLIQALGRMPNPVNSAPTTRSGGTVSQEPLFVPLIDTSDLKSSVSVQEGNSESTGVDEATAALKAARKRK